MPRKSTPVRSLESKLTAVDERTKETELAVLRVENRLLKLDNYLRGELSDVREQLAAIRATLDRAFPPPPPSE